uniref:glutathione S-transferase Mu 2-like n=1 Tax=Styela clava TaxID=7725 RepID=UPI001939A80E|nr:glutathione S-transferase Mu 2-like [Styela clava]
MGKLELGYWNIRGLAQPARLLLEYGGVEYEDKRYQCDMEPPYGRSKWLDVKFTLGLDFPNLPYMIDGDLKITESWAIYRYIARKIGMTFDTPKQEAEAHMLEGIINTLRQGFTHVCYNPQFEEKKDGMKESQLGKLQGFEKFLEGKKYLTGDKISHVDFAFYETLAHHQIMFPDIFSKFSNIQCFYKRFEENEKIAAYLKSSRFQKFPINNPVAKWGGKFQQD